MEQARLYFDVISPFAYLHYHRLGALRTRLDIELVPVLFAGLLKHWGTKGPAELDSKRLHAYQHCVWQASQARIPFRMPPRHPFNPLAAQRLLVALGSTDEAVQAAFHFTFGEGRDPELEFDALAERLGVSDAAAVISAPEVKQQLIANTRQAIDQGVFGVPTLIVRDRLFWGNETVEWVSHFLDEPGLFDQPGYQAAAATGAGITRA